MVAVVVAVLCKSNCCLHNELSTSLHNGSCTAEALLR